MTITQELIDQVQQTTEKELAAKLNNYSTTHLDNFRTLMQTIAALKAGYEFDVLYQNDWDFYSNLLANPLAVTTQIGNHYNLNDHYAYENRNGLIDSCDTITEFYSQSDIHNLTREISYQLKQDPATIIRSLEQNQQILLLQLLA